MEKHPIDFVITWVDGSDPEWQKKKALYSGEKTPNPVSIRYRSWENLHYWFRAVETYAPWVRKVHFVTDHQVPEWLNQDCPKLNIVYHEDYIDKSYLPLFNSGAIEISIHRIPGLADHFVYFNDDMLLTKPVNPEYFFRKGLPCDIAAFTSKYTIVKGEEIFGQKKMLYFQIINEHFDKYRVIIKHFFKWFSPLYGRMMLSSIKRGLLLDRQNEFRGLYDPHLSLSFTKKDFEVVWKKETERMNITLRDRFRSGTSLSPWVIRYWRLCEGRFIPRATTGKYFEIRTIADANRVAQAIMQKKYPEICINDSRHLIDFECAKDTVLKALQEALPNPSSFEK